MSNDEFVRATDGYRQDLNAGLKPECLSYKRYDGSVLEPVLDFSFLGEAKVRIPRGYVHKVRDRHDSIETDPNGNGWIIEVAVYEDPQCQLMLVFPSALFEPFHAAYPMSFPLVELVNREAHEAVLDEVTDYLKRTPDAPQGTMSRKALMEALQRVAPEQQVTEINLPIVLSFAATKLFMEGGVELDDDNDAALIRQALKDVSALGYFSFTPGS